MSNISPIADRGISPSSQRSKRNEVGAPNAEGCGGGLRCVTSTAAAATCAGAIPNFRRDLLDLGEREAAIGLRGKAFLTLGCPAKDLAELKFGEPLTPA